MSREIPNLELGRTIKQYEGIGTPDGSSGFKVVRGLLNNNPVFGDHRGNESFLGHPDSSMSLGEVSKVLSRIERTARELVIGYEPKDNMPGVYKQVREEVPGQVSLNEEAAVWDAIGYLANPLAKARIKSKVAGINTQIDQSEQRKKSRIKENKVSNSSLRRLRDVFNLLPKLKDIPQFALAVPMLSGASAAAEGVARDATTDVARQRYENSATAQVIRELAEFKTQDIKDEWERLGWVEKSVSQEGDEDPSRSDSQPIRVARGVWYNPETGQRVDPYSTSEKVISVSEETSGIKSPIPTPTIEGLAPTGDVGGEIANLVTPKVAENLIPPTPTPEAEGVQLTELPKSSEFGKGIDDIQGMISLVDMDNNNVLDAFEEYPEVNEVVQEVIDGVDQWIVEWAEKSDIVDASAAVEYFSFFNQDGDLGLMVRLTNPDGTQSIGLAVNEDNQIVPIGYGKKVQFFRFGLDSFTISSTKSADVILSIELPDGSIKPFFRVDGENWYLVPLFIDDEGDELINPSSGSLVRFKVMPPVLNSEANDNFAETGASLEMQTEINKMTSLDEVDYKNGQWEINGQIDPQAEMKMTEFGGAVFNTDKNIVYAVGEHWVGLDLMAGQNLEGGIWEGKTFSEIASMASDLRELVNLNNPEVFNGTVGSQNTDTTSSMVDIFCNSDVLKAGDGVIIGDIPITFIDINFDDEVHQLMVWLAPDFGGQDQVDLANSGNTIRFGLYHSVENVKVESFKEDFQLLAELFGIDTARLKENVEAINLKDSEPDWEFLENTVIFVRIKEF